MLLTSYLRAPLVALLLAAAPAAFAQTPGVGIGTTAPDASAALDIVSGSKGALLPRLTQAAIAAIASPATGLLVFQTDGTPGFYYNAGTAAAPSWQQIATASGAAIVAGNGLSKTGNSIGLGGTLGGATSVSQAGFNLSFTGAGNVGIGTTAAPGQKLEVAGSVYANGENTGFLTDNGSAPRIGLIKYTGRESGIWRTFSQDFEIGRVNSSVTALPGSPSTWTTDFYVGGTGNVGIGTSSPGQKLDVLGNVRVSGTSQVSNPGPSGSSSQAANIGQSFTITSSVTITSVTLTGAGNFASTLRLYAGTGNGGTALGTAQAVNLVAGTATTFVLTTPVVAAPGIYTLALTTPSTGNGLQVFTTNPYAGGTMTSNTGSVPALDLAFVVTYTDLNPTLDVVGSTRLGDLAGTGTRMVTAAADGTLVAAALPVDTDAQTLSIAGGNLTISGGNSVPLAGLGDNLGNHTATTNLDLGPNLLTGNGGSSGLAVSSAGSVGIGGVAPASAALAVTSTTQGFLPPRLTQTQRDAIGSPATGLQLYNTTTSKLNVWNGTSWTEPLTTTEQPYQGPAASFPFTGAEQTYTVPAGVTSLAVDASGAQGGGGGGNGGRVQTTISVTPGEVLRLYVGGQGGPASGGTSGGGYNGGGHAFLLSGGGGGTDIRRGGAAITDRIVVAGGGGSADGAAGGVGGGTTGGAGSGDFPGGGGTPSAGGASGGSPVSAGSFFQGGTAGRTGGGGGWYGGGGSGSNSGGGTGGAGGGSSYVTPTGSSGTIHTPGTRAGNGVLTLTPGLSYAAPTLSGSNFINLPAASLTGVVAAANLPALTSSASGTNRTLSLGTGNSTTFAVGDDLGSHNATNNLNLGSHQLVGNGGSTGLSISNGGNVGVGATAPGHPLTVQAGGGGTMLGFNNGAGADKYNFSLTNGGLNLSESNVASARLFVQDGGNVGIGTASPGQKLEVAGTIYSTGGGFKFPDNTVQTTAAVTATGTNFIQNQTTQQASANFNVSGAGTVGGLLTVGGAGTVGGLLTASGGARVTGDVVADAAGANTGTAASFLRFGASNSGEGIGSKRSATGNVNGLDFYTNSTSRLAISSGGNVGIGTSGPATTLDVRTTDNSAAITVAKTDATAGAVYLGNSGHGLKRNYGGTANDVGLYTTSGNVYLSASGSGTTNQFVLLNGGNVGIGTATPGVPLDVQSGVTTSLSNYGYLNGSGTTGFNGPTATPSVSIRASGRILASEFNALSDARLKSICGVSDNATDLGLLTRLRITDYTMRDRVQFGDRGYKKVIAQEVEAVFPQAVTKQTGFLPDVYATATTVQVLPGDSLLVLTLPAGLPSAATAGQRLKLLGAHSQVLAVVARPAGAGSRTLTVRGAQALAGGTVFVYGLEHADVRAVDYEALSMLNVSATQELARQLEALKARAATAEAKLQTVQAQATATTEAFEARLRALEAGGGQARK